MINNKTIIFLGSSVTYGYGSNGITFADLLKEKYDINMIKEAVNGTTLVDISFGENKKSYIERMKTIDKNISADAFICQLSTNDASKNLPLGTISNSFSIDDFDTSTISGAIEYIISYAKQTWNCPVYFYTGTKYDSELYKKMVDLLLQIQEKWSIGVIDLYNDEDMNNISKEKYDSYMLDPIHPNLKGYTEWWTPKFEEYLNNNL